MYLVVGLGNPEEEYSRTRHNMGFDCVNKISENNNIQINKKKFNSLYGIGKIDNNQVILVKPQTYMNLSGEAVKAFKDYFKIEDNNIIIIYDDIDIIPGKIRIRANGSAGTHNGIKSVVHEINSTNFLRVRIGVGLPEHQGDLINYILRHISDNEYEELKVGIERASKATEDIIKNNVSYAMNKYN